MTPSNICQEEGDCINCTSPNVEKNGRNQIHCRDCDYLCSVSDHFEQFDAKRYDIIHTITPYLLAGDWCTILDVYDTFFSDNEKKAYEYFDSTIFVKSTFPQYDTIYNFKKIKFPGNVTFYFPDVDGNIHSHLDKRLLLMYNSETQGMYHEALKNNSMINTIIHLDNKFKKHRFKSMQKLEKIFSKLYENHPVIQNKGGKIT